MKIVLTIVLGNYNIRVLEYQNPNYTKKNNFLKLKKKKPTFSQIYDTLSIIVTIVSLNHFSKIYIL